MSETTGQNSGKEIKFEVTDNMKKIMEPIEVNLGQFHTTEEKELVVGVSDQQRATELSKVASASNNAGGSGDAGNNAESNGKKEPIIVMDAYMTVRGKDTLENMRVNGIIEKPVAEESREETQTKRDGQEQGE